MHTDPRSTQAKGRRSAKKSLRILVGAAAAGAVATSIAAAQDFGPNTCLNGYVWRNAFDGDVVCVTTSARSQAAVDNARATSRRDLNGASGPNSCTQGFVWRVARPEDLVCVTPLRRSETAADNAAAGRRRNSVLVTMSTWMTPNTTTCDGNTCTTSNDSTTRHRILVTNINAGTAFLGLYRSSDRSRIRSWRVQTIPVPERPGDRVAFKTNQLVCSGQPNAYFRVKDPTSARWSVRHFVRIGCSPL